MNSMQPPEVNEYHDAAKLIEENGEKAYTIVSARFGKPVANALVVAHLRRQLISMDIGRLIKNPNQEINIDREVNRILVKAGILKTDQGMGEDTISDLVEQIFVDMGRKWTPEYCKEAGRMGLMDELLNLLCAKKNKPLPNENIFPIVAFIFTKYFITAGKTMLDVVSFMVGSAFQEKNIVLAKGRFNFLIIDMIIAIGEISRELEPEGTE